MMGYDSIFETDITKLCSDAVVDFVMHNQFKLALELLGISQIGFIAVWWIFVKIFKEYHTD